VSLLVMGHTHRPALAEVSPGRWYVNPGAWMDGCCYAIASRSTVELRRFPG
jgi:UDP-2,3-diacylglucosamine pyrophosphatase LpxH